MSWSVARALGVACGLVAATGCDVRPLEQAELMGKGGAPVIVTRPDATGPRMLSGSVIEACTGQGVSARVGIAGVRQCSVASKGAYFFDDLPEGKLALIAFKEGYKHFEVPVVITADGTIQDIVLQPDTPGGCADPQPADVACECVIPGCVF